MHPNFISLFEIELQLERERKLLNLTAEERLIRQATLLTSSNNMNLPKINLQELLAALSKRLFQPREAPGITLHTEVNSHSTCKLPQQQSC